MKGFELRVRVCLLEDIPQRNVNEEIANLINFSMKNSLSLRELHKRNGFKGYSFSKLIPFEKDFYKSGEIYDFYIRSLDKKIITNFKNSLTMLENKSFIVLDIEIINRDQNRIIKECYTATPLVVTITKDDKLYSWKPGDDIEVLKKSLAGNLAKKYNYINGTNVYIDADDVIENIVVKNSYPIVIKYKGITTFGNNVSVYFKENSIAQELAKVSYFLGMGAKNSSLGCGFVKPIFGGKTC